MNSLTSRPSYSQECGYHCTLVRRLRGTQIVMSAVKNTYIHTYIYIFQGTNTNQDIPFIQKAVTVLTSLRKINLSTYGVWWKLSITKISQICPPMGCDKGFGLQKYHKFVPVWGVIKVLDYKNITNLSPYGAWWRLWITKISQICPRMGHDESFWITKISQICPRMGRDESFGLQKYHRFVPVWGVIKVLDYKNITNLSPYGAWWRLWITKISNTLHSAPPPQIHKFWPASLILTPASGHFRSLHFATCSKTNWH